MEPRRRSAEGQSRKRRTGHATPARAAAPQAQIPHCTRGPSLWRDQRAPLTYTSVIVLARHCRVAKPDFRIRTVRLTLGRRRRRQHRRSRAASPHGWDRFSCSEPGLRRARTHWEPSWDAGARLIPGASRSCFARGAQWPPPVQAHVVALLLVPTCRHLAAPTHPPRAVRHRVAAPPRHHALRLPSVGWALTSLGCPRRQTLSAPAHLRPLLPGDGASPPVGSCCLPLACVGHLPSRSL